jgi:hypothetical protein
VSVAAIRNGLYQLLTASGPWAGSEISTCSFDVLTQTSGCAIVFVPEGTSAIEPAAYGRNNQPVFDRKWKIGGALYIRDTGDEKVLWGKVWQAYDDLYGTIRKDDSLGGAAAAAHLAGVTHRTTQFLKVAGHVWKPVEFSLIAEEFD